MLDDIKVAKAGVIVHGADIENVTKRMDSIKDLFDLKGKSEGGGTTATVIESAIYPIIERKMEKKI